MNQRHHEFRLEDIVDRIRRIGFAESHLSSSESSSQIEASEMAFDAIGLRCGTGTKIKV